MHIGSNASAINMQHRVFAVITAALLALSLGMLAGCDNGGGASSSQSAASSQAAEQISVKVTIDLTEADGKAETTEVSVPVGASVLEATQAIGLEMDIQDSDYGKYVNAINGVASGDYGATSGWLVALNGEDLAVSADNQEVSAGDEIIWRYVTKFE